MPDDILSAIDAAVQANLCGCGCGQQIPDRGPSPDFVNEKHQQAWLERRALANKPAGDWYTRLHTSASAPTPADYDDACGDPQCSSCYVTTPNPDETPMARVVRETSTLRKAIDKIRGIRQ